MLIGEFYESSLNTRERIMQEMLLLSGNAEKPQDENKVRFTNLQLLYAVQESDPVRFATVQLLYAVQEENL